MHKYAPPPALHAVPTPDGHVELTVTDVKALAIWIAAMKETGDSLAACSLVDQVP